MKKIITIARLKQIANAIRQKTNKTGALTLGQMPAEINSIEIFKGVGKFSDLKIFIPTSITQAQWDAGYDSMKLLLRSADVSSLTFKNCSSLTSLDLSFWDGGGRSSMENMFYKCSNLSSLDLSGFDTSRVSNMYRVFYNCSRLSSLDLSGFDTSRVSNMQGIFYNCSRLSSLDLSGFDTSRVSDMQEMFNACSNLSSLDLSGFDTSRVSNMEYMFQVCSWLSVINWPAVWSLASYTDTFDLSPCPLNHDSCLALFNALQDCNGRTVKLSTTTKKLMSADELKIATDKGVTIA